MEPYFGTGKVVIADGWFGSVRLAYALLGFGLYCIANVKTAHAGFPRDRMKEQLKKRGDTVHMQVVVGDRTIYASGH